MKELQDCLNTRRKINEIEEEILELRSVILSPKNQILTGMPRSASAENAIERCLIKLERKQKQKDKLIQFQYEQWQKAKRKMPKLTEQEITLFYYRFVKGMGWKRAVTEANEKHSANMTVSKAFKLYERLNNLNQKKFQKSIDRKFQVC